jgi:hypothetical protein
MSFQEPEDNIFDELIPGRRRLQRSLETASTLNPDTVASDRREAARRGMPVDTYATARQQNVPLPPANWQDLPDQFPEITAFLSRPENAAVAHDDLPALTGIERALTFTGDLGRRLAGSGGMLGSAIAGVSRGGQRLADRLGYADDSTTQRLFEGGVDLGARIEIGARNIAGTLNPRERALYGAQNNLLPQARDTGFTGDVVDALGQITTQIGVNIVTGGTGSAITMTGQGVRGMDVRVEEDMARDGRTEYTVADDIALGGGGVVTLVTEKLGLDAVLGRLPPALRARVQGRIANILVGGVGEGTTEVADTVGQNLLAAALLEEDVSPGEGAAEAGAVGGTAGAIAAFTVDLLTPGRRKSQARVEAEAAGAEQAAQTLQDLATLSEASRLREREPATFQQFVERVTENGPAENIYVDAQTFAQSLNDAGVPLDEVIAAIPSLADQLPGALATGGDVRITAGEFAAHLAATDATAALLPHMRTDPFAMSQAQAKEFMATRGEALQAEVEAAVTQATATEELRAGRERLQTRITEELNAAGRFTKDVNAAYASLPAAFYDVMAARTGMTAEQLADKYQLRFSAEMPSSAGRQVMEQEDTVELIHFSDSGNLMASDPAKWGASRATQNSERERRNAGAPGRTYFGVQGVYNGEPETGILGRPFQYRARVPAAKLYDFDADPQNLRPLEGTAMEIATAYEKAIQEAGFSGYRSDAVIPGAVALFDAVDMEQAGPVRTTQDAQRLAARMRELAQQDRLARLAARTDPDESIATRPAEDFREQALAELFPGGTFAQEPLTPAQASARAAKLADEIPGLKGVLPYLTSDEKAKLRRDTAAKITKLVEDFPDAEEMAAVAYSGRAKRGWYENSANAIRDIFGATDAPRFAALLAALSPQTSVESNAFNALATWTNWINAGRPTDKRALVKIMGESVQGKGTEESVLNAWINNSVSALTVENPNDIVLSGPKVNSFMLNLIGVVDEVTNDSWMANYALVEQSVFKKTGAVPGKGPGYIAMNAVARKAAEIVSEKTGQDWSAAEVQETVWSWSKTLYEMRDAKGEKRTTSEILAAGGLTAEDIGSTPDFAVLFVGGVFRRILEAGGYGAELDALDARGQPARRDGAGGDPRSVEGTGFDEGDFARYVDQAAARLEELRARRREGEPAETPQLSLFAQGPVAEQPLEGQPQTVNIPGRGRVAFGPFAPARNAARDYMADAGLSYEPATQYAAVDEGRAKRIAAEFEAMQHNPADPETAAAYRAMIDETLAQWQAIKTTGLKVEFITGEDPYAATPRLAILDVVENNHLWVFPTDSGFGSSDLDVSDNPLLEKTGEFIDGRELLANDVFRIVHDYFGHIKDGNGFRADGEENAWQSHAAMYSPLARRAMTTETRGQNSWVNFGPKAEFNRTASASDTVYADQKIGLLPEWVSSEGFLGGPTTGRRDGSVPIKDTPAFKAWFGDSVVKDEAGNPLVVYRGQHGASGELESRLGALSFGSREAASLYASEPNDRRDFAEAPVVFPVYLSIQKPVILNLDDPFIDVTDAAEASGLAPAEIATKFKDAIENTGRWEALQDEGFTSVADMVERAPERLNELYFNAYEAFDDADLVERFKANGYDGAVHIGNGETATEAEYKVFSPNHVKSVFNRGTFDPNELNILYQADVPARETPAFKAWFGDSKVVDDEGDPLVVYHGTRGEALEAFDPEATGKTTVLFSVFDVHRQGFYFAEDESFAKTFAEQGGRRGGGTVMPLYLSIQKPLDVSSDRMTGPSWQVVSDLAKRAAEIDPSITNPRYFAEIAGTERFWEALDTEEGGAAFVQAAREAGYDGFRMTEKDDNGADTTVWVALDSTQIKSVDNRGTFDPADPAVLNQPNRGQIAFGQDITQTPSVISLLRAADLSTFIHETGHFFLEATADIANATDAPADIVADMATVLNWMQPGMTLADWNVMSLEERRPFHEKWARGFEAYHFEGRSPSLALRDVFRRFSAWLKNVYKSLTALDVELTDEVRQVMDRMLATEAEITEMEQVRGLTPAFTNKPEFASDDEWEEYQRLAGDATAEAIEQLEQRSARDMRWASGAKDRYLRSLQREGEEQRKAIRAEVTAEVMAEPVNRARSFLRRGLGENGEPVEGAAKLDLATLKALYPADGPWTQLRRGGKYGEVSTGGLHPDAVASMFGYTNGEALIEDLVNGEDSADKIKGQTDQRMLERYGDLSDAQSLERAANEAVANEARAKFIQAEMAMADKAIGKKSVLNSAAKEFAASVVNRLELKRLRPAQYLAAQGRAAKAAEKALKGDDLPAFATAKRNQLVNLHTGRAVQQAQKDVEKTMRLFTRIVSAKDDSISRSRNMDLVNAARAVLASYGVGRVKNDPAGYMKSLSQYDPTLYADIEPFVNGARGDAKPVVDLTYEQFTALRDTVNQLWVLSRRTKQIEIDGKLMDREVVTTELGLRLDTIGIPAQAGLDRAPTDRDNRVRDLLGARAALRRVESWARGTDGANSGPFRKYIWNPISVAADAYRAESGVYIRRFRELLDGMRAELKPGDIKAPEIGYTFGGKSELFHALLHTGNGSNKSKLLLGRGWGKKNADGSLDDSRWQSFVDRLHTEGVLTEKDWTFVQAVWDLLEETKPGAQKAHRAIYGRYFDEVSADPVDTPFGQLRGGYVPAMTDGFLVQDAALRAEQEAIEGGDSAMFPAASNGFTKSRVEDYTRELALDLRLLPMHIDKVLKFTHLGPPVRDVARILKDRGFSRKLQAYDPTAQTDLLLPWLQRAAKQLVETPSKGRAGKATDRFFSAVRSRVGMQLMFANVVNTAQQVTGFSNVLLRVRAPVLGDALWQYVRDPKGVAEAAASQSVFLTNRMNSDIFEARQTIAQLTKLDPSKTDEAVAFLQRNAYFMQSALQNVMDVVSWTAAFNQAVAQGESDRDAGRFADSVIRETQGTMAPEDVSRFETGAPFVRLFTQFAGYFNMMANLNATEVQITARSVGLKKGMGRLFYIYLMGFAVPALIGDAIAKALRGGWEDEEDDGYMDDLFAWFFSSQAKFALAAVPVVGQAANAAMGAFTSLPYDDRISVSPAVSVIESGLGTPAEAYQSLVEGESFNRSDVRDALNLLGILTGTPVGALARPVSYGVGVAQGDIEPTGPADAARGVVTGAPSPESRQ